MDISADLIAVAEFPTSTESCRESSNGIQANAAWLGTMQTAVKKTSIVSEILDPRTRNLIQAPPPPLSEFQFPVFPESTPYFTPLPPPLHHPGSWTDAIHAPPAVSNMLCERWDIARLDMWQSFQQKARNTGGEALPGAAGATAGWRVVTAKFDGAICKGLHRPPVIYLCV